MEKSIKATATNYGLVLGLILALITVIAYAFMLELFTKWWLSILLFLIIVAMGTISSLKSKKLLGGYINFKTAFTSYFITILIGVLISTIVTIVIFNFIDTDAAAAYKELTLESQREMMENFGAPESQIEEAIAEAEKTNYFSLGNQAKSFAYTLVFFSVIGLIVALAVKKKDPNAVE